MWRWLFGKKGHGLGKLKPPIVLVCVMCRKPFHLAGIPGNFPGGMALSKCCHWPPRVAVDNPPREDLVEGGRMLQKMIEDLHNEEQDTAIRILSGGNS